MARRLSSIPLRILLVWGLFIVYATTLPFDLEPNLETAARSWAGARGRLWHRVHGHLPPRTDVVANVLLFLPWGFLLALHRRRPGRGPGATLLLCGGTSFALSLGVEALQLFSTERTTSVADIAANTAGGIAGGGAGWLAAGRVHGLLGRRLRERLVRRPRTQLAIGTALFALAWAASPFDFTLDVDDLKQALRVLQLVPFAPSPGGARAPSLAGEVPPLLAWCLIGGVFARAAREGGRSSSRAIWAAALPAAMGLALGMELVQLVVRSRVCDATSLVVALGGAGAGIGIAQRWRNRPERELAGVAGIVWFLATLAAGLAPWSFAAPGREAVSAAPLLPFFFYFQRTDVHALSDALLQVLFYAPLGVILAVRGEGTRSARAALAGGLVGALVEVGQLFVPQRTSDVTDAILAAAGATFGLWLGRAVEGGRRRVRALDARGGID